MSGPSGPVYGPVARRYGEPPAPDYAARAPAASAVTRLGTDPARWGRRVPAYLIDFAPVILASASLAIAYVLALLNLARLPADSEPSKGVGSALTWTVIGAAAMLAAIGWTIYNRWLAGGRTGQSFGKRVLRLHLVGEPTGEPVGPLDACARDLVHILDLVSIVGFLWPIWDDKRRTFADMILQTVVIDDRPPSG